MLVGVVVLKPLDRWRRGIEAAGFVASHPLAAARAIQREVCKSRPERLLGTAGRSSGAHRLLHVAALLNGNAGDVLLPIALRDLFDTVHGREIEWELCDAHPEFDAKRVKQANRCRGMVVGGGGLFLRDTNPNPHSGWQWNCPLSSLEAIRVPIALFAVGYNRFRGQPEFDPIFNEHLELLAEKATYLGLRNSGSIRALQRYLPERLHGKLRYQPCMTTLLAKIYPQLTVPPPTGGRRPVIALNAAFDRADLRFGANEVEILQRIAGGIKAACGDARLHVVAHCADDLQILPFMRSAGCDFDRVNLVGAGAEEIVRYYASVDLAIGMRGHAQMIPFGCETPIISLVSHDKLRWFLEDIGREPWGIEVDSPDLREYLVQTVAQILSDPSSLRDDIRGLQDRLWQLSRTNVEMALASFSIDSATAGQALRQSAPDSAHRVPR